MPRHLSGIAAAIVPAGRRSHSRTCLRFAVSVLLLAVLLLVTAPGRAVELNAADPDSDDPAERGAYVFIAAGCQSCHTAEGPDAAFLAGGRALETPFGTFYGPNITPDPEHGLGQWSEADLRRALRQGRGPDGTTYFPAFPYTSYTGMTDRDIADLWAYLQTVAPVDQPNRDHDLDPPFGWRWLLPAWRLLHFDAGPPQVALGRPPGWYRGAYLVDVLGHCGECHTPRTMLGGLDEDRRLAGNPEGPDGQPVPNITPHRETGIGTWSADELLFFFELGMMPDGDFAGSEMAEVIEHSTSRLTGDDRRAMVAYLRSLEPIASAAGAE